MGITKLIDEYERSILRSLDIGYSGLKWCELGNQRTWNRKSAKEMYVTRGVDHTSIDLNGQDGALKLDLEKKLPDNLVGKFDVVTNYGTVEHINNQTAVFFNVHELCKEDGIMFHGFPFVLNWPRHGRYYYAREFADSLAKVCNYNLVDVGLLDSEEYKYPRNLLMVTLRKTIKKFPNIEVTQLAGLEDSGDRSMTGDYTSGLSNRIKNRLQSIYHKF